MGHEVVGRVSELGKEVTGWSVGDAVAIHPATPCPEAGGKTNGHAPDPGRHLSGQRQHHAAYLRWSGGGPECPITTAASPARRPEFAHRGARRTIGHCIARNRSGGGPH